MASSSNLNGRRNLKRKEKVFLNVYDLMPANQYGHPWGIGVFHSGVQVGSKEYSFGGHESDWSGIFVVEPRCAYGVKFRESLDMGETSYSEQDVQSIVDSLAVKFPGNSYNLFSKNCNSFSDELCLKLVGQPIPTYVNRLAWWGSWFQCLLPPNLGIRPPQADNSANTATVSSYAAFSGSGNRLNVSVVNNPVETAEDPKILREKIAQATMKRFGNLNSN